MEKEKFQQKALKQTKQKKSKSAEFLMVKEERAATEGIENPAFNISSTDLSAYQPSEEKVIRHDKPDSTLAAHQQKLRLQAHAEPRGETSNLISLKHSNSGYVPCPTRTLCGLCWAFPSEVVQAGAPANPGWKTQNTAKNIGCLNI
nr:PREDICTED: orofacial cleft 1 candidate gene 1 protein homolog [Phalacrocorax carbo]